MKAPYWPQIIDITGQRFGRLVVQGIGPVRYTPKGQPRRMWVVRCDCGNRYLATSQPLRTGRTTQCAPCRDAENADRERQKAWRTSSGKTLWQVAARLGVKADTLTQRCRRGWDPDEAARTPIQVHRRAP